MKVTQKQKILITVAIWLFAISLAYIVFTKIKVLFNN